MATTPFVISVEKERGYDARRHPLRRWRWQVTERARIRHGSYSGLSHSNGYALTKLLAKRAAEASARRPKVPPKPWPREIYEIEVETA